VTKRHTFVYVLHANGDARLNDRRPETWDSDCREAAALDLAGFPQVFGLISAGVVLTPNSPQPG